MRKRLAILSFTLLFVIFLTLSFITAAETTNPFSSSINDDNSKTSLGTSFLKQGGIGVSSILGAAIGLIVGIFLIIVLIYVYFSWAIMSTAKKLEIPFGWRGLSWMPFTIPYLFSQMAKMHWWPAVFLPIISIFLSLIGGRSPEDLWC